MILKFEIFEDSSNLKLSICLFLNRMFSILFLFLIFAITEKQVRANIYFYSHFNIAMSNSIIVQ